jgi:hypothetical protein
MLNASHKGDGKMNTATKQSHSDAVPEITAVMIRLANVEACLSECFTSDIGGGCGSLYQKREQLVLELAALGAGDVLARTYLM